MIDYDKRHMKVNFWLAWLVANAIGLGLGWAVGELAGRTTAQIFGWRFGQLIGALTVEGILWLTRGVVLSRVQTYKVLKPLEIFLWLSGEVFGWIVSEMPTNQSSLMAVTGGAILATSLGASIWIVLWFIKIPKPKTKVWALSAAIWTFVGLVGGSIFIGLAMATSLQIGYTLAKMGLSIVGMALAGITLGALLGSLTGLAMIKLLRLPAFEQ